MIKRLIAVLVMIAVIVVAVGPVYAAISGVFNFGRGSLILTGVVSGLEDAHEDEVVTVLTGHALVYMECVNPRGRVVTGRNPILVSLTETSAPLYPDSNGDASVHVIIPDPDTMSVSPVHPTPRQAGCPHGHWRVRGIKHGSTRWQSTQVEVLQNGSSQLKYDYACADNGVTLTCSCISS
ncbi:MAG TPA: hypothetical protein PLQ56_09475 [Aggregatilineales bacterium]|nr:hypothetical protein [Anaerolineae bacterium]HUN06822.1 hypothetical protein [Aggregatilineales bacterium]